MLYRCLYRDNDPPTIDPTTKDPSYFSSLTIEIDITFSNTKNNEPTFTFLTLKKVTSERLLLSTADDRSLTDLCIPE